VHKASSSVDSGLSGVNTVFSYIGFDAMNTTAYLPQSKRLLDQVREVLR